MILRAGLTLLFVVLVSFFQSLNAQNTPTIAWDKSYGGNWDDQLSCKLPTSDGGFILGGASTSGISGNKTQASNGAQDFWVVKTDANGNKQWDKTYGGLILDFLHSIQQTLDGGYILAGESNSPVSGDKSQINSGSMDYWIIRIDPSGNKVWDKTIGGKNDELYSQIILTTDGGFLLGGSSNSPRSGSKSENFKGKYDFWVIKLDSNGNKIWDKTIGGSQHDDLLAIKQTSDGGYILGGTSGSGISGDKSQISQGLKDFWVVKIDANGNKQWDKTYGGNADDALKSLQLTPDGGYILGGSSTSGISGDKSQASFGGLDYWVVKTDANGNKQWDKSFGGDATEELWVMQPTSAGGYILGGISVSGITGNKSEANVGGSDLWIVNIDAAGNKLWDKTIGGYDNDWLVAVNELPGGAYMLGSESASGIGGHKTQPSKGITDYWMVKLNAPCSNLTAKITLECIFGGINVKLEVRGIQQVAAKTSWTLNYTENGVSKILTDSIATRTLAYNPAPGTVFSLVSLVSGNCNTTLNQTVTMPAFPAAPVANSVKRCGPGSVTFFASGAPASSKYYWYNVPVGGTFIQTDSDGKFTTPELQEPTIYYVAITNALGCEGPRTQVLASLNYCLPTFIPNIITQNNDGKNETFQPQNLPGRKWELQIFNRWGKQIYETEDYQNTWPETEVAAGTYYYLLINSETKEKFKGWVEVIK